MAGYHRIRSSTVRNYMLQDRTGAEDERGGPMDVSIEPAREEDLQGILEVMRTANMHYVPSPEMPDLDWRCYFVARVNGKIAGASGYRILSSTEAKTTLMAVLPEFRCFGIGRALQERRMMVLYELGIKTLTTNADIPQTIEWYKKHYGYLQIGKVKKVHEFGRADIDEWTRLQTDLTTWVKSHAKRTEQP